MARPIVLGVVGDSGSGKTTLTRGLIRVMGTEHVVSVSGDDYHRYERHERRRLGVTPLHPEANHLDVLTQHLVHLRHGEPVLKPVYDHRDGTLRRPQYVQPTRYLIVESLLGFHTEPLRAAHDVRVFLAPPEELRRAWKVKRDCTRRGYTTGEVLEELDRREQDAAAFIHPQRAHADIVVAFLPGDRDPAHLDAELILRDTLPQPDLSEVLHAESTDAKDPAHPTLIRREQDTLVRIPGDIAPALAGQLEESLWQRMTFANHLRVRRLGELTVGTDLYRSDSLALVQLLILYHLVWARAQITGGREPDRLEPRSLAGADSILHA